MQHMVACLVFFVYLVVVFLRLSGKNQVLFTSFDMLRGSKHCSGQNTAPVSFPPAE